MITGAHVMIYDAEAEALRAFFRDVLELPAVDAGGGWLILKLPPAELGVHPAEGQGPTELYFMCDDLERALARLRGKGVECAEPSAASWGVQTTVTAPGGRRIGLYEPRHARP